MTRAMKARLGCGVLAAAAAAITMTGCTPEALVKKSRPMTPEWVLRTPPDDGDLQYFVGRSVAVNVLDERRAMNKAMDDAIDQIARSVFVKVEGRSTMRDYEDSDEARGRQLSPDRLEWETRKTVITDTVVQGLRQMDTYWEIWKIRENPKDGINHTFKRYKFWVLVSCPSNVIGRCEEVVRESLADELDPLLKSGDDAFGLGNHEEAFRLYERAIDKYPYARTQVGERMAKASLELAIKKANGGDHDGALRLMRRGHTAGLPPDIKARMRERYTECYAEEAAKRVRELAGVWGWERVGVAPFLPEEGAEPPGKNVPVQIAHALARESAVVPSFRSLSGGEAGQIVGGVAYELDAQAAHAVATIGDDALVVGTVGKDITTFVYDVGQKRTHPVLTAPNLDGGDGAVADAAVSPWDVFVSRDPKFRVEAWTDQDSYRVGDTVTLNVRANRKCYMVIANVLPNGNVQAFIPVLQSRSDFVQPGRTYTVPNEDGLPFELEVKGPAGKESFRVIASEKPLALDDVLGDRVREGEFIETLGNQLHRLGSTPWTIAAHSFDVVR